MITQDAVLDIAREAIFNIIIVSAPLLLISLIVGLIISIFQTVTQIQESTLTFVPKIVGCVILLIFLLPWMFGVFINTVNEFMAMIPQLIGAM